MLTIQARPSTVDGKGVGRWRNYYRAEDIREVAWWVKGLVPSAQMRVKDGKTIVIPPQRVREYLNG